MRSIAVALVIALAATPAAGEIQARHKVTEGQTLWEIARKYACTVADLKRANRLDGSLIHPGQTIRVPTCDRPRVRKRLAHFEVPVENGQSVGRPWRGKLRKPTRLPKGKGYLIRRPARAYGTAHMVATIRNAVAAVRADHRGVHTLAIGDLSARKGGHISEHRSHQSGRDVDVGFFYKKKPRGYPSSFVEGTASNLDLAATWDLLVAFARTADDPVGVQAIFLDYDVQGLLYKWAKERGVSPTYLDRLFQYPEGKHGGDGLVRHEPHHDDHFHVRFKCPPRDGGCD